MYLGAWLCKDRILCPPVAEAGGTALVIGHYFPEPPIQLAQHSSIVAAFSKMGLVHSWLSTQIRKYGALLAKLQPRPAAAVGEKNTSP